MSGCLQLSANSVCGPTFAGVYVQAPSGSLFGTEAAFNSFVASATNECSSGSGQSAFGVSIVCSQVAVAASCGPQPFAVALCDQQCSAAVASLKSAGCDALAATRQASCAAFSPLVSTAGSCWKGADSDKNQCGFSDLSKACVLPGNKDIECCSNWLKNNPLTATLVVVPVTTTSAVTTTAAAAIIPPSNIIAPSVVPPSVTAPLAPSTTSALILQTSSNILTVTSNVSSTATTNASATSNSDSDSRLSTGAIAGIIVGSLAFLLLLLLVAWLAIRKERNPGKTTSTASQVTPASSMFTRSITLNRKGDKEESIFKEASTPLNVADSRPSTSSSQHPRRSSVDLEKGFIIATSNGLIPPTPSTPIPPIPTTETTNEPENLYRVIHNYRPNLPDELRLVMGATVIIHKTYPDGWADGTDVLTSQTGVLPLSCIAPLQTPLPPTQATSPIRVNRRKSSLSLLQSQAGQSQDPSTTTESSLPTTLKHLTAIRAYTPVRPDELKLTVGLPIILLKTFEDDWGKGYIPSTGVVGMFPLSFVIRRDNNTPTTTDAPPTTTTSTPHPPTTTPPGDLSSRTSSLNGMREEYHSQTRVESVKSPTLPPTSTSTSTPTGAPPPLLNITEEEDPHTSTTLLRPSTTQSTHILSTEGFLRMRVVHSYVAQADDELTLVHGMDVLLLKQFMDGWGRGQNVETGRVGMFPMVCVE
ncbi:hypothetical protein BCR33DRAFT_719507 [Rhizoclosmatium globosum]|uniref:SH3 domain-containing protein n=1 Tax=Rhizoclosmatium globosum TaxID=329046 RepID=A0A1Y2BZK0_9FUNG|nr:hypothetical protein BCR33DRAFT_719507 [Rhizoclosmatium globosum]|eukprot:ORY40094.1 hypothetical protein BCR33DRAFT_719507 [Rhizoclosmatium globosum]